MLEFEWDDAKAAANFRKHGVTFEQAAYAFRDPFAVEWIDARAVYGEEERVILLGMSGGQDFECRLHGARRAPPDYLGPQGNKI